MHVLRTLAKHAIRWAGPDAARELVSSLLSEYEHLSYRRLRDLGFRPNTIFDVGAYQGSWSKIARELFPESKIVMVEGQPALKAGLDIVAGQLGNARVHSCLLAAEKRDDVEFYTMGTGSSMKAERSNASRQLNRMPSTTLDEIWRSEAEVQAPVFIKIDVQGAELEVLRGAEEAMEGTEWIQLEVALLNYNEGAPQFAEVCAFMTQRGFLPTEITGFSRPQEHLVQIDVLFARDGDVLRPTTFQF